MHTRDHCARNIRLFLFVFFLTGTTGAMKMHSQTFFFDNYSTQQGFESKVYAVVQDRHHYVWLGTQTGVYRFDGISFIPFTADSGLAEGAVRVLFIDGNNTLWLGHEGGGITRYNGRSFEKIILKDSLLKSNITSFCQDADNQLWITTASDGALLIRNPGDRPAFLEYEHYLEGKRLGFQVFGSLATTTGDLYFITNVGIRKYNKHDHSFDIYLPRGMSSYFSPTVIFEDSRGNLWLGTYNGGLSMLNHETKRLENFDTDTGLGSNWITAITEDRNGNIWVGHWKDDDNTGGISRIDPSGRLQVFNTSNGLHDDHIWCITEDAEGNMLIGTTEQGLDIFKGERFVSLSTRNGLAHNQVNTITTDPEGQIWLGTSQGGISIFNPLNRQSPVKHFNQSNQLISDQIRFFRKDSKNNIWIGTADMGIMVYNTTLNKFVAQPLINRYIPAQNHQVDITALEIDNHDHLWIGTLGGLVEYDIENNRYVASYTQGSGLAGNHITTLYAGSNGDLWIGSKNKGITRLHEGRFSIVSNLGEVDPTCITEDLQNNLWVGTTLKGVISMYNDSVRYYTKTNGLLANLINLLACDENNNIYVGTNYGLNRIDRQQNKITSYTRATGFTGIETNNNAWCIDHQGFLWIGTAGGAVRCNPALLSQEDTTPPVVRLNEMRVKGIAVNMIPGMKLRHNQNDISFGFISISLKNPRGINYHVMLQGSHNDWLDLKNEHTITYNKLPPGKYKFHVRVRNDQGVWSAEPATYSFRILAPPYKRGYFIVTIICILVASVITYIKIREKALVQEKKILEEKVEERTHALSEVNEQLVMRNRDITDSITYAKRIQFAILPPEIPFNDTFILFKPKDIVSGDFYWMNTAGGKEFLAAVDCTGHGVPGAFMSFIGFTSLNKIIIEQGIYQPAAILNRLNEEVATTLHQKGEDIVNDGMDIALICISPQTGILEYAGAFNPLLVIRQGELIEIKADRFAIGRATGREKTFTNHEFQLEKGDTLYLFSDGYADQFGGPNGKKYKISTLKELLINISGCDMESQQEIIESTFEDWRGDQEQVDDVLIVGRRY